MTIIDALQPYLVSAAGAVISVAVPFIVTAMFKRLGLEANAQAITVADNALNSAAGVLINHGVAAGDALLTQASTKSVGLSKAIAYVNANAAPELKLLGITPDMLAAKITARAGTMLAPAVSTTAAVAATAKT